MDIDVLEKEINNLMERLSAEAAVLESGNKFVDYARQSSEEMLGLANGMLESFNQVKKSFESLEQRVGDVDFPTYFDNQKETMGKLDGYINQIGSSIGQVTSDVVESKKLINATSLVIDKHVQDIIQKIEKGQKDTQEKIGIFQIAIDKFIRQFDEVGFHQKFKDIEHTMVKFAVEQESIKKNIDSLVSQQNEVMRLMQKQSERQEEIKDETKQEITNYRNEQSKMLRIVIIINAIIICGIGFLVFKTF